MENMQHNRELNKKIPVVIPSYEPDEKLVLILEALKESGFTEVIIVDDGSEGKTYQDIFLLL